MQQPLRPVLVSAALAFAAYAAFVQWTPFQVPSGQNQNDTNLIRAEDYLAAPNAETVLVGSSLTFRVPAADLGPRMVNLAFAGGAPATGLALIRDANARPVLVLVEINLLQRGADRDMIGSLLRFPEHWLRTRLKVFRTGHDPVNLTWRGMAALMHKADFEPPPPSPEIIRQLTADQRREKLRGVDINVLRHNLAEVSSLVAALRARGVRVGFFEMPVDPSLADLPSDATIRREALRAFPRDRFCWLNLAVPGGPHTFKGVHLDAHDAALVARQIADQRRTCINP